MNYQFHSTGVPGSNPQRPTIAAAVVAAQVGTLFCLLAWSANTAANDDSVLASQYPELQQLLLAHDVVQARAYEEIAITNESPTAAIGQRLLLENLAELAEAEGSHYHSAGDHLAMLGPHRVFESRATPGLLGVIRQDHDADRVRTALADAGYLPPVAVLTL